MNVFIGMETSGALRTRFQAQGHTVVSVDRLPTTDGTGYSKASGGHVIGDVFHVFQQFTDRGWRFDLGIFHPECTYLTNSAAWAFKDPDFARYPGVGYHQRVKPGTLTGSTRRAARDWALDDVRRILALPIPRKALENPIGAITRVRPATQIINPFQFGDDASKSTVLILDGLPPLVPTRYCPPRMVCQGCGRTWAQREEPQNCDVCSLQPRAEIGRAFPILPRWANQTDSGQNRLSPSADRWSKRSKTYPGIADAMAAQWALTARKVARHD